MIRSLNLIKINQISLQLLLGSNENRTKLLLRKNEMCSIVDVDTNSKR